MNMNWKEFIKPTIGKIIILIVAIVLTSIFNTATFCPGCTQAAFGFPFTIYEVPGCEPVPPSFECPGARIVYSGLIFNLAIWYIVSCLIMFVINKLKK